MPPRISLVHLTFASADKPPAAVHFGPSATIIRGPSDTGKSYVADAIDFMLGAEKLRVIPHRAEYTHVLLGVRLADSAVVTLMRSVDGGRFTLYETDIRSLSDAEGVEGMSLAAKHSSSSQSNLSRYLLGAVGLEGKLLRRNASNAKVGLSFRDVAHLTVIDETRIQDETPPGIGRNETQSTKDLSALKLFLEGEDDSALVEVLSKTDLKKITEAQAQVIDRMLDSLLPSLEGHADKKEFAEQREKLKASIESVSKSIEFATSRRSALARSLSEQQRKLRAVRERIAEARSLVARFGLLEAQYSSDLARLAMVEEAGSLLHYFAPGICPFCGADPAHQHFGEGHLEEESQFLGAIVHERAKTLALQGDLDSTLGDLQREIVDLGEEGSRLQVEIKATHRALQQAERALEPEDRSLKEYLDALSACEEMLRTFARVDELRALQLEFTAAARTEKPVRGEGISIRTANEFSAAISRRLEAWGYPDAALVRYDLSTHDLVDGDQLRSAHGKGVRAVLHAAFTVALADYCLANGLPHPGFVVLDSPLVTYKPPKKKSDKSLRDNRLNESVIGRFYGDLEDNFAGQIIILENTDPPSLANPSTVDIEFTKETSHGRYGLFPPNRKR